MAGHSHWKQIKEQKKSTDQKRGELFSKLLKTVSIAAQKEPNPDSNSQLRAAIEKARKFNIPQENIQRAIEKQAQEKKLEEVLIEAYSPGGSALIIKTVTDNKNRTVNEIKSLLKELNVKRAEVGSVRWAFELDKNYEWQPKYRQETNIEEKQQVNALIEKLENHPDVEKVYTNA